MIIFEIVPPHLLVMENTGEADCQLDVMTTMDSLCGSKSFEEHWLSHIDCNEERYNKFFVPVCLNQYIIIQYIL